MQTERHPSGRFTVACDLGDVTVEAEYYMEGVIQTNVTVEGSTVRIRPDTYLKRAWFDDNDD